MENITHCVHKLRPSGRRQYGDRALFRGDPMYTLYRNVVLSILLHCVLILVHGQVTVIFVVSVCLSVCLCRVFLSRL